MRLLRPGRSRGRALWSGRGVPCSARARASGSGAVDVLSVVEQAALDAGARPVFGEGGREGSVAVEEELGVDLSCGGWWCGFNVPARVGAASVGARGHALEGLGTTGGAEEPVEERGPLRSFRRGLACGCGRYAALGASVAGASGVGLAVLLLVLGLGCEPNSLLGHNFLLITQKVIEVLLTLYARHKAFLNCSFNLAFSSTRCTCSQQGLVAFALSINTYEERWLSP